MRNSDNADKLSPALIRRLPMYFRALIKLYGSGKERISSEELASEISLAPSQVRTDIKALGCQGQRSYGYSIASLYRTIAAVLQLSDKYKSVIAGNTPLAAAIMETPVFMKRGVKLCAVFRDPETDIHRYLTQLPPDCPVYGYDVFPEFFGKYPPDVIILADTPEKTEAFAAVLEKTLSESTVKPPQIWNFSESQLTGFALDVKNIHISDVIMLLCLELGKN